MEAEALLWFFVGAAATAAGAAVIAGRLRSRIRKLEQQHLLDRQEVEQGNKLQEEAAEEKRELNRRLEQTQEKLNTQGRRLAELESAERQRVREVEQRIQELEEARKSLNEQRSRILQEEQKKAEEEQNNRDRMWALHEQQTIDLLREMCSRSDLYFPCYGNTDIPQDFDPQLKPDFLIRFLDQYVIFDAKLSKSQNLQAYTAGQAKQTAKKMNASSEKNQLFPVVFFIIPSADIGNLKTVSYYEEGFSFFCISPEAIEPILSMFKRLESYEFAEAYHPQEREQIIQVIAAFEHHIRHQNAVNIISTLRGIDTLEMKESLDDHMRQEITDKRKNIRIERFSPSSLRKLIQDDHHLRDEILRIVSPKAAPMDTEDFSDVE